MGRACSEGAGRGCTVPGRGAARPVAVHRLLAAPGDAAGGAGGGRGGGPPLGAAAGARAGEPLRGAGRAGPGRVVRGGGQGIARTGDRAAAGEAEGLKRYPASVAGAEVSTGPVGLPLGEPPAGSRLTARVMPFSP